MNNYEVIGIQRREYDSKKTGQHVTGYNIFVAYQQNGVDGVACESLWVSDDLFLNADILVGDKVNVMYNRYGRVASIAHC